MLNQKRNGRTFSSIAPLWVIAGGSLILLGCSNISGGASQSTTASTGGTEVADLANLNRGDLIDKIAENGIQVGDDLYMIPNGIDDDGCETFGPFSKTNATVTAMHYRQADGSFSIAKDPAVCGVQMASLGTDESGCEMYQAQPVNGVLEPTDVVYYRDADGRYLPNKPKTSCS